MAKTPAKDKPSRAKAASTPKNQEPKPPHRPRLIGSPEEMLAKAEEYFKDREAAGKPPTMAGICYWLGFSDRHALAEYEGYDGFSATVKRLRLRIEQDRSEQLVQKDTFSPGQIFDLKNNHGWKDKSEVELTGNVAQLLAERRKRVHKGG